MESYANLAVVLLVVTVSVVLLFLLLHNRKAQESTNPQVDYVAQILAIWILAWGSWGILWGIKATFPAEQFSQNDFPQSTQLWSHLQGTNTEAKYVLSKLSKVTGARVLTNQPSEEELKTEFASGFNKLVKSGPLFNPTYIDYRKLSTNTVNRLGAILNGNSLVSFNRQLLGEIFKDEIIVKQPVGAWKKYLTLGLSSFNSVLFILIIIVILQERCIRPILVWMYGALMTFVILVYCFAMFMLAHAKTPGGIEKFDELLVNWSIAESVIAPLLLTVVVWRSSGKVLPLIVGILYAFAQPIVYQADMDPSSLVSESSREVTLVSLAFLKIFLAASVLYAFGRYASTHITDAPFKIHSILKRKIQCSMWNATISALIVGGVFIWYFMAGDSFSGLLKAGTSFVALAGAVLNILNLKGESAS